MEKGLRSQLLSVPVRLEKKIIPDETATIEIEIVTKLGGLRNKLWTLR